MTTPDPMEQLATLGKALGELAQSLGLEQHTFVPVPDLTGDSIHIIQSMFIWVPPSPDDAALQGILGATAEAEQQQARKDLERIAAETEAERQRERGEAALNLQRKLEAGGGILDD